MAQKTVTLPDGSVHERLYKCADCKHVSDTHDSKSRGHEDIAACENCGNTSLMLEVGDFIKLKDEA